MHKVAKLRSGWSNPSESYVSYSWILEEAARVFVTSLVYAILNWGVLDMVSEGASGTVTGEDRRSYIKIETLRGKTPTEIVAIDETWVRDFELELKSQSNEWRSPSSPWPKKFRQAQRSRKWWSLLMITEESSWQIEFHVEQVWQRCIIMTGCKNCAGKCTKIDLTCSGMGHSFCTTMHALTWGRLWPICWVNMSGKCYLTRHTVQTWVHQTSTYFPS